MAAAAPVSLVFQHGWLEKRRELQNHHRRRRLRDGAWRARLNSKAGQRRHVPHRRWLVLHYQPPSTATVIPLGWWYYPASRWLLCFVPAVLVPFSPGPSSWRARLAYCVLDSWPCASASDELSRRPSTATTTSTQFVSIRDGVVVHRKSSSENTVNGHSRRKRRIGTLSLKCIQLLQVETKLLLRQPSSDNNNKQDLGYLHTM